MKIVDYFDFLMHGAPWFYLTYLLIVSFKAKLKPETKEEANIKK